MMAWRLCRNESSSCAAAQQAVLPRHFVLGLRKPHNKFHGIQKCECCDRFFARFATSYFSGNCTQLHTTATQQSPCHLFLQTSTKGQPHASFGGGAAADDRPKKVIKKKIVKTKKDKTPTATIGKWTICFVPGVTDKAITVKGTVITDGVPVYTELKIAAGVDILNAPNHGGCLHCGAIC